MAFVNYEQLVNIEGQNKTIICQGENRNRKMMLVEGEGIASPHYKVKSSILPSAPSYIVQHAADIFHEMIGYGQPGDLASTAQA